MMHLDRQAALEASTALPLGEKLAGQEQVRTLEAGRHRKRRSPFDARDDLDRQCDELIAQIEGRLRQQRDLQFSFTLRRRVV